MKCQGPLQASAPLLAPSTLRQPQPCPGACRITLVLPTILIGAQRLRTCPTPSQANQPLSTSTPCSLHRADPKKKNQALFNGKQKKPRQSLHRAGLAEPPGLQTAQALPKKGPRLGSLPQRKAQSGQLSDHRAKNNVVLPGSREHRRSRPQRIKVIFIHPWSPAP